MAAIRHTLQRDIFLPQDERLIDVVHVSKTGKKKKSSFLCATVTTDKPIQVAIHKVKKVDKDNFKKRQTWQLVDLNFVDGKNSTVDVPEFDLHFEKPYKWIASNISEKNNFIACMWKLSQRYIKQLKKPDFINVKPELMEEFISLDEVQSEHHEEESGIAEDYHALSSREEVDLKKMMNECEYAIGNAEAFVEQLANDLSVLDGANIHSIIDSQKQVASLMAQLDDALTDIDDLENNLDGYDEKLERVRAHMEVMEQKDSMIQIQRQNHHQLISSLTELADNLDLKERHVIALSETRIGTVKGLHECKEAAKALQKAMQSELSPALEKLQAVIDQRQHLNNLQDQFAKRLAKHLNSIFIQQGNEMSETLITYSGQLSLPKHSGFHKELKPYSELMQWLKWADKDSFYKLSKVYIDSISKLYEREFQEFIEKGKQGLHAKARTADGKKHGTLGKEGKGSSSDISRLGGRMGKLNSLQDMRGSDIDLTGRQKFDMIFTQVLAEFNPVCRDEQEFASKFFGYVGGFDYEVDDVDGGFWSRHKKIEHKAQPTDLKSLMTVLFPTLEQELRTFVSFAEKTDNFFSVFMLVRISHDVLSQSKSEKSTASYLHVILANCLVEVKRNFDKYIEYLEQSIMDSRVSKKSRCGILPFVKEFEIFAEQAETVFKGSERRRDLDKAYSRLMIAQNKAIHRIAMEHLKTPRDVIIFENFHYLHATFSRLKITSLENEKKDAKQRYQDHMQSYVIDSLGRPMEKLTHFFEGVQALVAQGVKEEEVGYQMAFNKQELRKVVKEYPNKEVKKGLENLYKKVEKTLCEETNLMQVVWHFFQDEFIRQYKHIDDMISRCYRGSNVRLEFSIQDVLQYFSDIAQSH